MTRDCAVGVAMCLTIAPVVLAQNERSQAGRQDAPTTGASEKEVKELPSPFSLRIYKDGDLRTRSHLTGDWGGERSKLASQGFTFDVDVTQIFHQAARGGKDTNNGFRYSGEAHYTLTLDTARLGWWPAGQILLKGETQFGRSINGKVGSVMSVNSEDLFPIPEDPGITTLTEVVYTQFLSETFGFSIGKIDFRGGDKNVFANNETTQFMNLAFLANPLILSFAPYSALTATLIFRPSDELTVTLTALDSFGRADTSGFDTAFHSPEGTAFFNEWDFTIKPFGQPGHQRVGVVFSTKDFTLLDQDLRLGGPFGVLGLVRQLVRDTDTRPDDWMFYYNFDQYLYTESEDPSQGIGVFGRFGWSDGEATPIEIFYSIGVGGKGVIPERDNDTFGLGYYYADMSYDIPFILDIGDEQGIELYYNIEVTPWMHITPDVQYIIDPGGGAYDDAIAVGIRTHISF